MCGDAAGTSVRVRYNPSDPSDASIPVPGSDVALAWLMSVGGGVVFVALVFNHFRLRKGTPKL